MWTPEDGSFSPTEEPITAEKPTIDGMTTSGMVEIRLPEVTAEEAVVKTIKRVCQFSDNTKTWHVKSGKGGKLQITMTFNGKIHHLHFVRYSSSYHCLFRHHLRGGGCLLLAQTQIKKRRSSVRTVSYQQSV